VRPQDDSNGGQRMVQVTETGRIPVSEACELGERNPFGGTGKAERRRTQGAANVYAVKRSGARSRSAATGATD
jgi:hypothetical protein